MTNLSGRSLPKPGEVWQHFQHSAVNPEQFLIRDVAKSFAAGGYQIVTFENLVTGEIRWTTVASFMQGIKYSATGWAFSRVSVFSWAWLGWGLDKRLVAAQTAKRPSQDRIVSDA